MLGLSDMDESVLDVVRDALGITPNEESESASPD
jgi:hypothetical protein